MCVAMYYTKPYEQIKDSSRINQRTVVHHSAVVRHGIVNTVKRALKDSKVNAVVICGQNGSFCGGKLFYLYSKNLNSLSVVAVLKKISWMI